MAVLQALLFYLVVSEINYVLTSSDSDRSNHDSTLCATDTCLMKCCPFGKVLNYKDLSETSENSTNYEMICDYYNETRDSISNLDSNKIFYNKPNLSIFDVKSGIFEKNKTFMENSWNFVGSTFNIHLTEHAEILLETPNAYERWIRIPNSMYCWEYSIKNDSQLNTTSLEPGIWIPIQTNVDESKQASAILITSAMLVSSFFLFLVLVVYGLLPELRNLWGLILMSYVTSLLGAFLLLAVIRVTQHEPHVCVCLTLLIYFSFMASFCWMNVMSFDIWWSFRRYAEARPTIKRGHRFKFLIYCLYGWGVPLTMTTVLTVLNSTDMRHIPWLIMPNIGTNTCFFEPGEQLLYMHMPMLILILFNWMFYFMTAFNIWLMSRGTAVLDSACAGKPQAHRTLRHRFLVYLRLSIVMGLNWLLEVVSSLYPNIKGWFFSDFFNVLVGVSIFFIFVCKRKILKKLKKLFSRKSQPDQTLTKETTSSTCDSSIRRTLSRQASSEPKGSAIAVMSF